MNRRKKKPMAAAQPKMMPRVSSRSPSRGTPPRAFASTRAHVRRAATLPRIKAPTPRVMEAM